MVKVNSLGASVVLNCDFPATWEFQDEVMVMLAGGRFWTATVVPNDVAWQPEPCDESQPVTQTIDHFFLHYSHNAHMGSLMTLADGRLLWVMPSLLGDKSHLWCWVER